MQFHRCLIHHLSSLSVGLSNGGIQSGGSVTLPRTSATREERLIKFSGIGPVDETGMPIASRSVSPSILSEPLQSQNAFMLHTFSELKITMKHMAILSCCTLWMYKPAMHACILVITSLNQD